LLAAGGQVEGAGHVDLDGSDDGLAIREHGAEIALYRQWQADEFARVVAGWLALLVANAARFQTRPQRIGGCCPPSGAVCREADGSTRQQAQREDNPRKPCHCDSPVAALVLSFRNGKGRPSTGRHLMERRFTW